MLEEAEEAEELHGILLSEVQKILAEVEELVEQKEELSLMLLASTQMQEMEVQEVVLITMVEVVVLPM